MSATIALVKRDAVYLMVDALGYDIAGVIRSIHQKAFAFPAAGFAISTTGPSQAGLLTAFALEAEFASFDALLEDGGAFLRRFYSAVIGAEDFPPNPATGRIGEMTALLVGWSAARRRCEIHSVLLCRPDDEAAWLAEGAEPFILRDAGVFAATPTPDGAEIVAAEFAPFFAGGLEAIPHRADPEIDLLHFMEIQRRHKSAGRYIVGGYALLTTITERGITQRVVQRWPEDKLGELVMPLTIDWPSWRAERVRATAPIELVESRLRREMRERRERKKMR